MSLYEIYKTSGFMEQNKNNPARERIWGSDPMGLMPLCQQCKDCILQFVSNGDKLNPYDWAKGYCLAFNEDKGLSKPRDVQTGDKDCPHKISFGKAAEIYKACEHEVLSDQT
ncbi:MAG: hypothetical protein Q4A68_00840 [Anaerobiospirillum succiniciproducens]|uniref:hypothetical protein n=1 Tax=Anaerobiospirillum succiniciproducens TaxID=13335 RepID=UPI0026DD15D5|nr:hypothetical protein [Anaerobiospirillum succiniciproducens]MDO4675127.1 hypothetical protein [Anaerobiospirillum succiniciproducens]